MLVSSESHRFYNDYLNEERARRQKCIQDFIQTYGISVEHFPYLFTRSEVPRLYTSIEACLRRLKDKSEAEPISLSDLPHYLRDTFFKLAEIGFFERGDKNTFRTKDLGMLNFLLDNFPRLEDSITISEEEGQILKSYMEWCKKYEKIQIEADHCSALIDASAIASRMRKHTMFSREIDDLSRKIGFYNRLLETEGVIRRYTEQCPVIQFFASSGKEYQYSVLPFDSRMTAEFMDAMTEGMLHMLRTELQNATVVLLPEAKAFPLVLVAKEAGLDAAFIRKRDYKDLNLFVAHQEKAYAGATDMYCTKNALDRGDKPIIVDDMISSGGTQIAIIHALQQQGFPIAGIGSAYERGDGIENIKRETGYEAKALARIEIEHGKTIITRFYHPQPS